MSDHTDQIASAYRQLAEGPAGKLLFTWIDRTADEARRHASRTEPTKAFGELRFADGLEEVKTHITQMCLLPDIKPASKAS